MFTEKVLFEFKDVGILKEAERRLSNSYRNGSRKFSLEISDLDEYHSLTIEDVCELLPYSVFEFGNVIGSEWMMASLRIEPKGWKRFYNKKICHEEPISIETTHNLIVKDNINLELKIGNLLENRKSLTDLKPFITPEELNSIAEFSNFNKVPVLNDKFFYESCNRKQLCFLIQKGFMIFFDIEFPQQDFSLNINLISAFEVIIYGL